MLEFPIGLKQVFCRRFDSVYEPNEDRPTPQAEFRMHLGNSLPSLHERVAIVRLLIPRSAMEKWLKVDWCLRRDLGRS